MFTVDATTRKIDMHRGDTGVIGITATGYTFGVADRAVFTLKTMDGSLVKEEVHEMTNNRFEVEFKNPDTDYLDAGSYKWDVRYAVNPVYNADGRIVDGEGVDTPTDALELNLRGTVGQI